MSWLLLARKLAPYAAGLAVAALLVAAGWMANGWRLGEQMASYREQVTARAAQQVQQAQAESEQQQQALAEIDKQHTQELVNAKSQIADLSDAVAAGRRRLRISAQCPSSVSAPGTATGVDDGGAARLDDAAQRDYFRLRRRIAITNQQISGLQDYIRTQCLRSPDHDR